MLYYCPSGWIYGETVTGDLRVESGHLRSAPREQVRILAQASFDLLPCQVGESGANLHSFAWVLAEGDEFEVPVELVGGGFSRRWEAHPGRSVCPGILSRPLEGLSALPL